MSYEAGTCSALSMRSHRGPVAADVKRTRRRPSPYESAGSNCRVARPAATQSTERQDADALEIRLDVTVLWCQCLARELSRELATNPLKEVPGFTGADLRALGYCVASASCLSVLWVAAGLATRQFEPADSYGEGLRRVLLTSAATGPLWLVVESALQVPASYDTSLAHYSSSLLGLAATMALVRTVR